MEYLVVSFTHKNTNIATREKLAFNSELEKEKFLKKFIQETCVNEAILLSTCNRVELLVSTSDAKTSGKVALKHFSNHSDLLFDELYELADIYENDSAVHHIFTVASSLDSLVVGETQIAGQLKDAFKFSLDKEFCGVKLSRVLNYAFKCAARVRNATQLGTGSVSVASTAVAKAKELYENSDQVIKALVIGAGEMSELACRHLLKSGFDVVICSRNIKKARVLAHSIISDGNGNEYSVDQIQVKPYEELSTLLNSMKLMVTATAAPYAIITSEMVSHQHFERNWFDIALPRDIGDIKISNLNIYRVDDLQCIVDENLELRASQAKEAFAIVGTTTKEFFVWLQTLNVEPVVKSIYLKSESIIEKKVANAIKKHYIKEEDEDNIKKLCQSVMAEFLHNPSKNLKEISTSVEGDNYINTAKSIFGINEEY